MCIDPNCRSHAEMNRLRTEVEGYKMALANMNVAEVLNREALSSMQTAIKIQRKTLLIYEHKISALNEVLREEKSTRVSLHMKPVVTVDKVQTAMQTT